MQQAVVFHFRYLAERIAKHNTIVIYEDRLGLVVEQQRQLLLAVLGGIGLEQIRSQTMMHHIHLMQQVDETRNVNYIRLSNHTLER